MLAQSIPGDVMKIEQLLNAGVSAEVLTYLNNVSDCRFESGTNMRNYFIFTQSMHDALEKMRNCWKVCLNGAKGCGKSYTLAILFLMLQCKEPCLYLTRKSFTCNSYFLEFLYKFEKLFRPSKLVNFKNKFDKEVRANDVIDLIYAVLATNCSLKVFIDFGKVSAYPTVGDHLHKLYKILSIFINPNQLSKYSLFFAVSSGIYAADLNPKFTQQNRETCRQIRDVMSSADGLQTLTGYTAAEVDKIFTYLDVGTKFNPEEVKQLCGCNPLLISCLHNCNNMDDYAKKVKREVDSFIDNNLSVVKDINRVTEFFSSYEWDTGRHFLHIAMQEQRFSEEQYKQYQTSWLCDNRILIVEEDLKVRFNFPTIGQRLIVLLRNFVPNIKYVEDLAFSNPSVGGFVLERVFIDYIQIKGTIAVTITSARGHAVGTSETLTMASVTPFKNTNLVKNTVYELYSCHPIIDYVGYLESQSTSFLVFIQLSLSKYKNHVRLHNMLAHSPKSDHLRESEPPMLNLLQFYSYRASSHYGNGEVNVLLLYLSPQDSEELLPELQKEVQENFKNLFASFNFFVGVAPKQSNFFGRYRSYGTWLKEYDV